MNERSVFSILHFFSAFSPFPPAILFLISGTNRASLAAGRAGEQGRAPPAWCSTATRAMGIELPCAWGSTAHQRVPATELGRCALMDARTVRPALGASPGWAVGSTGHPAPHSSWQQTTAPPAPGPLALEKGQGEVKASVSCPIWLCSEQEHSVRQAL